MTSLSIHMRRLVLGIFAASGPAFSWSAPDLRVDLAVVDSAGSRLVRLRTFTESPDERWMVALDPVRLETSVRRQAGWIARPDTLGSVDSSVWSSLRGLERAEQGKTSGLAHLPGSDRGVALTVDLCPSKKRLDRRLIQGLREAFGPQARNIPVAFAITGSWIRSHEADLAWLAALADSGILAPTWVNHSDHHNYRKGLAPSKNFLLLPGTDVRAEILGAETEMLRHGLVPSIYFRFPGLVENPAVFGEVLATGLLALGSDAWLAKDQKPGPGSIVLIHGNGNEPKGVKDFLQLLQSKKTGIRQGTWRLETLRRG